MNPHEAKSVAEFLIADFENEMQTTQRVLAAVPADRLDYQPDAKAKTGLGLVRPHYAGRRMAAHLRRERRVHAATRRFRRVRHHEPDRRGDPLQGQGARCP